MQFELINDLMPRPRYLHEHHCHTLEKVEVEPYVEATTIWKNKA